MKTYEVNFDGLVGPTHNYAGLSVGNVASIANAQAVSSPRRAAHQGLDKMQALRSLGLVQGVLAPQERPDMETLRRLGFTGSDGEILEKAGREAPVILQGCWSASSMWTANAATVSPSRDTSDGRVHMTPANLINKFHRSLEPDTTGNILAAVFPDERYFKHHRHLPAHEWFGDEGAANHTRLCAHHGAAGVEVFVYGREAHNPNVPAPARYPARQTLEASRAIARLHGLSPDRVVYAQQNPAVIDQGVFHNDVIAVGNENVLLYHEQAFVSPEAVIKEIRRKLGDTPLHCVCVATGEVSVEEAVKTYLFNTQIVTLPGGSMAVIAPLECRDSAAASGWLDRLVAMGTPIDQVHYLDVKQSMQNGGGPACLRLRVALSETELAAVNPHCLLDDALVATLRAWIDRHYRDELAGDDLRDPALLNESRAALDELTGILHLGSVYPFQQG